MKDHEMFKNYMTLMGEIFNKELSKVMMEFYWNVMKEFSDEEAEDIFKRACSDLTFFPKPAELKNIGRPKVDDSCKASLAWTEVDNAVRTVGNYASVQFSDPVIHSVIQAMGGWSTLCQCTNDEWKWKRVEFEKLYPTMAKRGGHDLYLLGDAEQSQRIRGSEDFDEPKRVGYLREQAKQLLEEENKP